MDPRLRVEEILRRKQINLTQLADAMHRSAPNVYTSLNNKPQFDFIRSVANSINKIEIRRTFKDYLKYDEEEQRFIKNKSCVMSERKKLLKEYLEKKVHISDLIARESTVYGYLSYRYGEIEYSKTFEDLNDFKTGLNRCLLKSKSVKTEDVFKNQIGKDPDKLYIISRIKNLLTPDNDDTQLDEGETNEEDIQNELNAQSEENVRGEYTGFDNENSEGLFDDNTARDLLKQIAEALNDIIKSEAAVAAELEKQKGKTDSEYSDEEKKEKIPVVRLQNLIKSITSNPNLKRLSQIAKILNLNTKDLLSDTPKFQLRGIVNLNGEMITVESVRDLYYLKEKSKNMIVSMFNDEEIIEQIKDIFEVKKEYKIVDNPEVYQKEFSQEIEPDYLDMTRNSRYDGKTQLCYSFRKRGDTRYGNGLNFSNMIKLNKKMKCLGKEFWDSECAYIAGYYSLYDNTNEGITYKKIQEKLSEYSKGGYNAKGIYRKATNEYTIKLRTDFHISNLNFEWMKIVIFEKAKTNNEFRATLLRIPLNAHIIEDTSYFKIGPSSTAMIWGCQNKVLTKDRIKYRSKIRMKLALENADKKTIANAEQTIDNLICDNGEWVGQNATGKAIKLVQLALIEGGIPPINFDLINNNENGFYWFGERIRILATTDGKDITYEVIRQ